MFLEFKELVRRYRNGSDPRLSNFDHIPRQSPNVVYDCNEVCNSIGSKEMNLRMKTISAFVFMPSHGFNANQHHFEEVIFLLTS